jgi:Cft2 family RNA processing exonuclease
MSGFQSILILISCFVVQVYSKTTIMVVLGCANEEVQQERVSAAVNYVSVLENSHVVWFVTGGVKNSVDKAVSSEAAKMSEQISTSNRRIVLDEKAKNTAENFAYLKKWINESFEDTSEIVITTSEFHQERASRIFNGIFYNENENVIPEWNLSISQSCRHCFNDEKIHMRNVAIDIKNAVRILA